MIKLERTNEWCVKQMVSVIKGIYWCQQFQTEFTLELLLANLSIYKKKKTEQNNSNNDARHFSPGRQPIWTKDCNEKLPKKKIYIYMKCK